MTVNSYLSLHHEFKACFYKALYAGVYTLSFLREDCFTISGDFNYSSSIQGQEIRIKLVSSRSEFLPYLLYFNDSRVFLDYGLLDLKRKKNSFLWGIKRIEGEDNLENLKKNYYYKNYIKLNFLLLLCNTKLIGSNYGTKKNNQHFRLYFAQRKQTTRKQ